MSFAWTPDRFNRRVQQVLQPPRALPSPPEIVSLAFGSPDPGLFPAAGLAEAAAAALRDFPAYAVALQYGNPIGNPVLLAELARKLEKEEGRPVEPGSLTITSGSSQALPLVFQALADPGAACLLETPTFLGTVRHIRFNQIEAVPVPLGDQGLDLQAVETTLGRLAAEGRRPRFLYTIPTFNNPAGLTMPLERRLALLDLCAHHELPIVEDDAYRDLWFDAEPPPTLHALDRHGLVIRLGTFSKIVAPGVRLGFVQADPAVIERTQMFKAEGVTNGFASLVVGTFMRSGGLASHVEVLRRDYQARRDALLAALAAEMPGGVTWTRPGGGFFVWLTLPERADVARIAARMKEEQVVALPGPECYPDGRGSHHLRLAFSLQSPERLAEGARRLGRAVRAGL
jgi:2-aminoadipate transaminase